MQRRRFLGLALSAAALAPFAAPARASAGPRLIVAKSPTCGCCTAWAEHMQAAGFEVETRDVGQAALNDLKRRVGLSPGQTSCHTAVAEGYFVEGHVPAEDVTRMLAERPAILGLTVPDMPVGSPGMEMGDRRDPYDVLAVLPDGETRVFASYR
jgi:hypothetical protein